MDIKDLEQKINDLESKLHSVEDRMLTFNRLIAIVIGGLIGFFVIEKIFKFFG